jgi:hypothetical protein
MKASVISDVLYPIILENQKKRAKSWVNFINKSPIKHWSYNDFWKRDDLWMILKKK